MINNSCYCIIFIVMAICIGCGIYVSMMIKSHNQNLQAFNAKLNPTTIYINSQIVVITKSENLDLDQSIVLV